MQPLTITGVVDGSNDTFTITTTPLPAGDIRVFVSGSLKKEGLDYSLAGVIITFFGWAIPQPGDFLEVLA
jgi:hypothetical protein